MKIYSFYFLIFKIKLILGVDVLLRRVWGMVSDYFSYSSVLKSIGIKIGDVE